jgi:hypothetical protein
VSSCVTRTCVYLKGEKSFLTFYNLQFASIFATQIFRLLWSLKRAKSLMILVCIWCLAYRVHTCVFRTVNVVQHAYYMKPFSSRVVRVSFAMMLWSVGVYLKNTWRCKLFAAHCHCCKCAWFVSPSFLMFRLRPRFNLSDFVVVMHLLGYSLQTLIRLGFYTECVPSSKKC